MNILALDTSTEACSAALLRADGEVFGEFEIAPREHNRLLPLMMERVLAAAALERRALTHCAFANGPGAFTGIRIAAAQAQGIGIALGLPLLPISTLAVLAQVAVERLGAEYPLAALDARMDEIYWARYRRDGGLASLQGAERLTGRGEVELSADTDCAIGHGWRWTAPDLERGVHPELLPDARALLALAAAAASRGLGVRASAAGINYLRNRVAEKSQR